MNTAEFRKALNLLLRDELAHLGFCQVDSSTFVRKTETHEIFVIWIQKHSSESKVCVNLGIHYDFLPKTGTSELVEGIDIAQPDCEIKKRLTPDSSQNDHWWPLGKAEAYEIASLIKEIALPYFEKYYLSGDLGEITPEQLDDDPPVLLSSLTKSRACLLMARINEVKEKPAQTAKFAKLGIIAAGMAVGPKKALKEILRRVDQIYQN